LISIDLASKYPLTNSFRYPFCLNTLVPKLDKLGEFWYICSMSSKQKERLWKAKIAVALQSEYGRVPTKKEIEDIYHLTRVMYKAVLGLHFKRKEQKKSGQLAIF
jgi:hypothetical protein